MALTISSNSTQSFVSAHTYTRSPVKRSYTELSSSLQDSKSPRSSPRKKSRTLKDPSSSATTNMLSVSPMPAISLPHNPPATSSHSPLPYKRTLAYQRDQRDKRRLMIVRELSTVFASQAAAARCGSSLDSSSNTLGQRRRVPSLQIFCPPPLKPVPTYAAPLPQPPLIITPPAPRPPRAASPLCPSDFTPLRASSNSESFSVGPSSSRVPAPPPPNTRRPPSKMEKTDEFLKKAIRKCISATPEGAMMLKKGPRRAMEDVRMQEEARVQDATMELERIVRAAGLDFSMNWPSSSHQSSNLMDRNSGSGSIIKFVPFPSTTSSINYETVAIPDPFNDRPEFFTEDWEMIDVSHERN